MADNAEARLSWAERQAQIRARDSKRPHWQMLPNEYYQNRQRIYAAPIPDGVINIVEREPPSPPFETVYQGQINEISSRILDMQDERANRNLIERQAIEHYDALNEEERAAWRRRAFEINAENKKKSKKAKKRKEWEEKRRTTRELMGDIPRPRPRGRRGAGASNSINSIKSNLILNKKAKGISERLDQLIKETR